MAHPPEPGWYSEAAATFGDRAATERRLEKRPRGVLTEVRP